MGVYTNGLYCCAVQEISCLNDHLDPGKNLASLCANLWFKYDYNSYPAKTVPRSKEEMARFKPSGFYIFTAHVGYVGRYKKDWKGFPTDSNHQYGHALAAYIKRHKLGSVVASREATNRVNEPDHIVKVWVWRPNEKRLQDWWLKFGHKIAAKPEVD